MLIECARLFSASLSSAGRGAAAGLAGAVRCWMWVRGAARGSAGHQGADLFYFIRRDHWFTAVRSRPRGPARCAVRATRLRDARLTVSVGPRYVIFLFRVETAVRHRRSPGDANLRRHRASRYVIRRRAQRPRRSGCRDPRSGAAIKAWVGINQLPS